MDDKSVRLYQHQIPYIYFLVLPVALQVKNGPITVYKQMNYQCCKLVKVCP